MKSLLRVVASLAISGVFLWLASRDVEWAAVGRSLATVRVPDLALIVLATFASLVFRALRWKLFLDAVKPVPFRAVLSATAIGFAANMLLPLRAGEVIRPWVLSRDEGVPFASGMATIAVERLFDMATLIALFGYAALTLPLPEAWRGYGWAMLGGFGVFLGAVVALWFAPERCLATLGVVLRPFPDRFRTTLEGLARGFAGGLGSLSSARSMATAVLWSVAVWLSIAVSFGFGLTAFGLDVPLVDGSFAVTAFVAIAVAVPGGPGFVGQFQLGATAALRIYGVEPAVAFGYSVLVHVVSFVSTVIPGVGFFLASGLGVGDVGAVVNDGRAPAAERD